MRWETINWKRRSYKKKTFEHDSGRVLDVLNRRRRRSRRGGKPKTMIMIVVGELGVLVGEKGVAGVGGVEGEKRVGGEEGGEAGALGWDAHCPGQMVMIVGRESEGS